MNKFELERALVDTANAASESGMHSARHILHTKSISQLESTSTEAKVVIYEARMDIAKLTVNMDDWPRSAQKHHNGKAKIVHCAHNSCPSHLDISIKHGRCGGLNIEEQRSKSIHDEIKKWMKGNIEI